MDREEIGRLLSIEGGKEAMQLCKSADFIKRKYVGKKVYFRGIIEFSNICQKDCFYCGIRRSNRKVKRYKMGHGEILECAKWAFSQGYGSIVLQSGELQNKEYVDFLVKVVQDIKKQTMKMDSKGKGLGITLSVGEQAKNVYEELFESGAHRYLLRIETSNPKLYAKLHPRSHSFSNRVKCLQNLKEIGYQVGTGVMIGLPGQTISDLANDIIFYKKIDADMFGMGPYVLHKDTPLAKENPKVMEKSRLLQISLNMVAVARIFLKDVNIASTTALDSLNPRGREMALEYGANVIMPVITPQKYRASYLLYDGKPCISEDAVTCKGCISRRIKKTGLEIGWEEYGDSKHYFKRNLDAL